MQFSLNTKHPMQEMIAKALLNVPSDEAEKKIENLVRGLDDESKECVYRIISRVQSAFLNNGEIGVLTSEENEELEKIYFNFSPKIYMLTPQKYYYNGYYLPIKAFEIGVFWHEHSMNSFEPKTLERIYNSDIIDVGGFVGDSAIVFRKFTKGKIHTFEATSKNYAFLQKTLAMNESSQIVPNKLALGDKKGKLVINLAGSASSTMYKYEGSDSEEVDMITLDEYVDANKLKVGFIKVDIEGAENIFLQGALNTIKKQRPAMLISIYHHADQFFGIKPFIESLGLGYKFKVVKPVDSTISIETALYCEAL